MYKNPYYHPEDWGLTLVADLDFADSYEFDIVAVWKDNDTGQMYYANDSGCSCPTPFEDYHNLGDLIPLTENSLSGLRKLIDELSDRGYHDVTPLRKSYFLWKVTTELRS